MELKIVLEAACFRMDMLTKGHDMGLYEKNTSKSPLFIVFTVKKWRFRGSIDKKTPQKPTQTEFRGPVSRIFPYKPKILIKRYLPPRQIRFFYLIYLQNLDTSCLSCFALQILSVSPMRIPVIASFYDKQKSTPHPLLGQPPLYLLSVR